VELCLQCDGATKSTIKKSLAAAPAAGLPQREGETAVFVVRGAAPIEIELCHLIKQFIRQIVGFDMTRCWRFLFLKKLYLEDQGFRRVGRLRGFLVLPPFGIAPSEPDELRVGTPAQSARKARSLLLLLLLHVICVLQISPSVKRHDSHSPRPECLASNCGKLPVWKRNAERVRSRGLRSLH